MISPARMGLLYELELRDAPPASRRVFRCGDTRRYFATDRGYRSLTVKSRVIRVFAPQDQGLTLRRPYPPALVEPPDEETTDSVLAMSLAQGAHDRDEVPIFLGRGVSLHGHQGAFYHDGDRGRRRYAFQFVPRLDFEVEERVRRQACDYLRAQVADPDTRVALSLGSGTMRAVLHILVLKLLDAAGVSESVDEVWGTSAGAMAGLAFATGCSGAELERKVYAIYRHELKFGLFPTLGDVAKGIVGNLVRRRPAWDVGFFDTRTKLEPIARWVAGPRPRRVPMFCVAYNVAQFRREVLTPDPMPALSHGIYEEINQTDLMDAVCGSCAVPGLFQARVITRRGVTARYYDGYLCEQVPLEPIYKRFLADQQLGIEKRKRLLLIASNVIHPRLSDEFVARHPLRTIYGLTLMSTLEAQVQARIQWLRDLPNVLVLYLDFRQRDYSQIRLARIPEILGVGASDVIDPLLEFAAWGGEYPSKQGDVA